MPADHPSWEFIPAVRYGRGRSVPITGGVDHYIGSTGSARAVARWVAGLAVYKGEKVAAPPVCGTIIIGRGGEVIQQVLFADRAMHAGTAPGRGDFWLGDEPPRNVNDFTAGLENSNAGWLIGGGRNFYLPKKNKAGVWVKGKLYPKHLPAPEEARGDDGLLRFWEPYTEELILANIEVKKIMRDMGLVTERSNWTGHSDVSPARKHDPGPLFPGETILDAVFGSETVVDEDDEDISALQDRVDGDLIGHYDDEAEMCLVAPPDE